MVMWDEIAARWRASSPTCLGQGTGRRRHRAHGQPPGQPGHHGRHQPARRHPERPGRRAGGSLGIAPTGNIDPERRYPSMFEPIHGSAFDIMGQGLANPVGTFWSCVMLLEAPGRTRCGAALMQAIETVTATPALHTRDLGGKATTAEVTQAVPPARLPRGLNPAPTFPVHPVEGHLPTVALRQSGRTGRHAFSAAAASRPPAAPCSPPACPCLAFPASPSR